jgi:DNA polymerase epsilon subunit 1
MEWVWRGDHNPATRNEYDRTKDQLAREPQRDNLSFAQLPDSEQAILVAERLKTYARKAYKRTKVTEENTRQDVVCMRENNFYVDTVRQFRDRRYEYKKLNKTWKKRVSSAKDAATKKECEDRVLVYDSLQIAHKCILNSFYGYVMRRGARWRSMEMAGIVTKTGADIITQARVLVEQIGRPLELDTDGIWCILPRSFPDVYTFQSRAGSHLKLEYPCVMLNADVHNKFTNHQYQTLVDPVRGIYETRSECSIFFEVDGPYRCMVLPASTEEGKLLKKRYAVFNFDGSLAELKGFELKRRGELELIKTFQSQVFERFLDGSSLKDCYESVAEVANHWIDVIDTRGDSLDDEELVGLISENRSMSRQLDDYGDQKGTSQTTARRLGEFLGAEIIKDKGLNCKFIIAEQPYGAPVTDRAIPTAIWKAESSVMKHFLRKWLKSPGLDGDALDIRNVLDWDYYLDRLGKSIQKIITIPAALQKIPNPVPRVEHPGWLTSKVNHLNDRFQQQSIQSAFSVQAKNPLVRINELDIEDSGPSSRESKRPVVHRMRRHRVKTLDSTVEVDAEPHAIKERVSLSKEKFGDWLAQKKKLWRKLRSQRSVPAKSDGVDRADKKARTAHTIESYVRDAALAISQKEWQIVEMREMSSFDSAVASSSGSGELVLWTMVGTDSLQKIVVTVPRTVYISTRVEAICTSSDIHSFRKVDRHLPRGRCTSYLYEVCMPEYVYRDQSWISSIEPVQHLDKAEFMLESVFESGVPLLNRALTELGSFCRVKTESQSSKGRKGYLLTDLIRVERPATKEYLHRDISFSRIFLYVRTHPRTKTGVVALYVIDNGKTLLENTSGREGTHRSSGVDFSRPAEAEPGTVDVGCSCHIWIIKPGSKSAQRNVTIKQCESLFFELTQTIQEAANLDSDYACVSPKSKIKVSGLRFVDQEELAFAGANEAISAASKASSGPSLILLSSSRPAVSLRRYMSTFGSLPVVSMNFPPGPSHNPDISTLPALNWEQPAVQLCFEAYLFMYIIAFPKRVSYARYGRVPLGNLGDDENMAVYDVNFSRLIGKNRAVSWANPGLGKPDLGANFMVSEGSSVSYALDSGCHVYNQDEIWGDDDELVSPVIRRPGCYRSICVDIDVYDLAIAALTDLSSSLATGGPGLLASQANPSSPNNVALFDSSFGMSTIAGPLGDEMSTVVSLPIARALVCGWLKDAMNAQSDVADELLHHVYRLISSPQALLHDPALHRAVHGLMKTAFFRILGELQRLGCSIIYASFHRITVATNKIELADAEEYINFVIATARKRANENNEQGDSLSRVALRPRQFHTHFVFLDEYNFGSVQLERVEKSDLESENDFNIPESEHKSTVVVPSVITAWSVMNYLGSQIGHEYFRAIIGRFSKDVFKKQMELVALGDRLSLTGINDFDSQLLDHKRQMVRKHFASYLTRAVSEILKDSAEDLILPPMYTGKSSPIVPALEFIKNVTVILELDADIETEVHVLKRSLLAQIGVAEYAKAALWENPCPKYILPDVFCTECYESRDLNLCYVPPREIDNKVEKDWVCEDCGSSYDVGVIERRLISLVNRKVVRYQLQDVRCTKTNRVATRALAALSDCSAGLKLDLTQKSAKIEVTLLRSLADYHGLECLRDTTDSILSSHVVF